MGDMTDTTQMKHNLNLTNEKKTHTRNKERIAIRFPALCTIFFSFRCCTIIFFYVDDDEYGTASFFLFFLVSSSFSIDRNVARQEQYMCSSCCRCRERKERKKKKIIWSNTHIQNSNNRGEHNTGTRNKCDLRHNEKFYLKFREALGFRPMLQLNRFQHILFCLLQRAGSFSSSYIFHAIINSMKFLNSFLLWFQFQFVCISSLERQMNTTHSHNVWFRQKLNGVRAQLYVWHCDIYVCICCMGMGTGHTNNNKNMIAGCLRLLSVHVCDVCAFAFSKNDLSSICLSECDEFSVFRHRDFAAHLVVRIYGRWIHMMQSNRIIWTMWRFFEFKTVLYEHETSIFIHIVAEC